MSLSFLSEFFFVSSPAYVSASVCMIANVGLGVRVDVGMDESVFYVSLLFFEQNSIRTCCLYFVACYARQVRRYHQRPENSEPCNAVSS